MSWFNRNRKPTGETEISHDHRVEVVVHQNAAKDVVKEAKAVNEHLNKLLIENGFTLKIYLAAGGQLPSKPEKRDQ